jgi:hypothetical protein
MPGLGDLLGNMFRPQQVQQPGQAFADPMAGMGPMDRLGYMRQNNPEALMSLAAGLMNGNMGAGFAGAGQAMGRHREQYMEQQKAAQKENMTKRWLMADKGLSDEEATMAMSDPAILGTYLKTGQGQGYINAGGGNLFNSETGEWVSAPGGGVEGVAGLQPVWLRDEKTGRPVIGQLRKDGTIVRSGMPDGTEAIGPYDVNFDKAAGTASGKGSGEAAVALPGVRQMAGKVSEQVEALKNDPYLPRMLGPVDARLPNVTMDSARVQSKIQQLAGEAFLSARQALKGGGAITDYEGQKAEAALARLNQAQSEEDFKAALDEFNYHVQLGLQLLEQQASQQRMNQGGTIPAPGGGNQTRSGVSWSIEP